MSLLAPLFLLGLLTALLPWWLHRLSASNPPKQDFGSTRFLDPDQTPSSSKRRTRYWPLLALRFLFLALLSLLFAEPVIEQLRTLGSSNTRHILVIDTSMSQSLDGRWQRTLDTANEILSNASGSDQAVVISASDQFVQNQQEADTVDAAISQLGTLQPGNTRLDYGRIGSAIAAAVADEGINNHLHIITDIQATSMPGRFTSLAVDKVQEIKVYSTAAESDSNASVTGTLEYANNNNANVVAVINNYGDAKTMSLSVTSNNTTLENIQLDVESNEIAVHHFSDIDITEAESQLELRLNQEDALPSDNTWLLPLPDKERTEITLLTSDVQPSVATTYIKAALESNPRFSARLTDASRFSTEDAGSLIVVPDASVLSDRAASRLREYLTNGGSALVAVGDKPHSSGATGLFGIGNGGQASNEVAAVGSIDQSHQVTTNLIDNWRAISVLNHHKLNTNITDRNIIELTNGSPLLVEKRMGAGKMLLLAAALNPQWTDLPTESVFVAFMMQAVEFLGGDTSTTLYRSTGESISVPAGAQLIGPDDEPLRALSGLSERTSIALEEPGIYQLQSSAGTQSIAVNFEPAESDIRTIDNETLTKWEEVATSTQIESNNNITDNSNQKNFWVWLLPFLLLLALLESLYSHRHLWIRREA